MQHPYASELFRQLKDEKLINETVTKDEWKKALLDSFHNKLKESKTWPLRFDIKNGFVFENLDIKCTTFI